MQEVKIIEIKKSIFADNDKDADAIKIKEGTGEVSTSESQ